MVRCALVIFLGLAGCPKHPPVPPPQPISSAPSGKDRAVENRLLTYSGSPLYWASDEVNPGEIDSDELVTIWQGHGLPGNFEAFEVGEISAGSVREASVIKELDMGRPTLVKTHVLREELAFVVKMIAVADRIEEIHALQRGSAGIEPAPDDVSKALFWRNQGPWCESASPEEAPDCRATVEPVERVVGVYPASVQTGADWCAELEAHKPPLMEPFTAVRLEGEERVAIPYSKAFPEATARLKTALMDAAEVLPAEESALADYLRGAAEGFVTDDWVRADRLWLATRDHSKWYVRVGPDETYWEPCDRKAGYHLVFARINPASLEWQERLEPIKQQMEAAIAERAGPYRAREVAFSLPEFIDIVVNAGDSRAALGGTTGQSLPNWGPVAEAGGRTVAMTNLNIDADSLNTRRERAESLLCSVEGFVDDPEPLLVSTVLHEAAHNLGPASGYRVEGRTDEEVFGGELATMLEELKAQTAAMFLTDWLAESEVVTAEFARQAHMADLVWMLGQIAAGMVDSEGDASAYPQLSAIQLGLMLESGAVRWEPDQKAANGTDKGCLEVDLDALPAAVESLSDEVFGVKGRGDLQRAKELKAAHVEGHEELFGRIADRWFRGPSSSFVYGFEIE